MTVSDSACLLLKRHSLDDWRALAKASHAPQYQRLLREADRCCKRSPPSEHPSDSITYIGTGVMNLALAHLLSGEGKYLEAARRWISIAAAYPHWGKERMPDHDLDAAWLLFGLGLGYDWLKRRLPAGERAILRDKLIWQGQQLYAFALETEGKWWSSAYWQNHNWICYGGLATAGYALGGDFPEAADWTARARDNFTLALAYMPEDGSNYEGPVYWRYGVIWFLIYADLLRQETGIDLHDSGFLRNTFYYRLYLSGPNLIDTANFGDCHDRRSAHTAAVYARLADLYAIGEAQWLYQHFYENGEWEREGAEGLVKPGLWAESGLEFLWYQPAVKPKPVKDLPLSRVFPDLGLLTARDAWHDDALMMAIKCGAPNGMKAWHSGNALNAGRGWQTLSTGHDHPDANSFILIKGGDYLAVDDGYAKVKRARHHSTLLIDGQGQYAEGAYNAFRGLDASFGARLEATIECGSLVYARGEAARAYDRSLRLRQFTRETLFLDGDAVVIRDVIAADAPHRYEWLLQTDAPPQAFDSRRFRIQSGSSVCHLHALQPSDVAHHVCQQEITANPTSAKPDWIIRRLQYALALSPPEPVRDCAFFVILDVAGFAVERVTAERGILARLSRGESCWRVGFCQGRDGILASALDVDGAFFAGHWQAGKLTKMMAGAATSIWLDGELHFAADLPLDLALRHNAESTRLDLQAAGRAWIRFQCRQPRAVSLNGRAAAFHYDEATGLAWLRASAGQSEIVVS